MVLLPPPPPPPITIVPHGQKQQRGKFLVVCDCEVHPGGGKEGADDHKDVLACLVENPPSVERARR